jgi:hypothetical protein
VVPAARSSCFSAFSRMSSRSRLMTGVFLCFLCLLRPHS